MTSTKLTASETSTHNRNTSITCLSVSFLHMDLNQQTFKILSCCQLGNNFMSYFIFLWWEENASEDKLKAKLGKLVPVLQIWNFSCYSKNCPQFPVFSDHYFLYLYHSIAVIIIQKEENGARTPPDLWSAEKGKTQTKAARTNSSGWPWTPRLLCVIF